MGHAVTIHPVIVLVAVTAGTLVHGVSGALVAVPVVAVTQAVMTAWRKEAPQDRVASPTRPGPSAHVPGTPRTERGLGATQ